MQSFLTASTIAETWISRIPLLLAGHRGEELLLPARPLLGRRVFLVRGETPAVARGILDRGEAVAPEHVGDRHHHLGPGPDRAIEGGVHVGQVEVERGGGMADRRGRQAAHVRILLRQHDAGVADLDLGVHEPAVRAIDAHDLPRAERALVEVDRRGPILDGQGRGHGVIALGNWLRHDGPPQSLSLSTSSRTAAADLSKAACSSFWSLISMICSTPRRPSLTGTPTYSPFVPDWPS